MRELFFIWGDVDGLLVREDYETGLGAGGLFHVADLRVVDGNLRAALCLAEMRGEHGGEQDGFL